MTYAEPENMTGIMDIFRYANTVSDSIFGIGMLVSLYIIVFAWLHGKGEESLKCFIAAGFITSIVSVFLFLGGLVENWHMFMVFMITVLSALWGYWGNKGG